MKKMIAAGVMALAASGIAHAAKEKLTYPISGALNSPEAKETLLLPGVAIYFGDQQAPAIVDPDHIMEITVSREVNGFGKSNEKACQLALLASLKALQERAARDGATAVISIKSDIEQIEFSSATEFQCVSGTLKAATTLKGRIVKLQ